MQPPTSDFELLDRWCHGDSKAGSELVARHFDVVHRFFLTKSLTAVDDLVQQTFLACLEKPDAFRSEAPFRAYLLGIARHQLLTYFRRARAGSAVDFTTSSLRDLGTSPSSAFGRCERQALLRAALESVPLDQQIALELAYWEGLRAPEIAAVLGIPENTVYSRLRRAKAHVRRALTRMAGNEPLADSAYDLLAAPPRD